MFKLLNRHLCISANCFAANSCQDEIGLVDRKPSLTVQSEVGDSRKKARRVGFDRRETGVGHSRFLCNAYCIFPSRRRPLGNLSDRRTL